VSPNKIRAERSEQEVAVHQINSQQSYQLDPSKMRHVHAPHNTHTATSCCLRQYRIASGTTPGSVFLSFVPVFSLQHFHPILFVSFVLFVVVKIVS